MIALLPPHPTWDDCIAQLFAEPYWLPANERKSIAAQWQVCMSDYDLSLNNYHSVRQWSVTIFNHLASRSMPLTTDSRQFWPEPALAAFARWVNEGCRRNPGDPINEQQRIPPWQITPEKLDKRRDIESLSEEELNRYRMALDDTMQVGNPAADSPWQQLAYVHTNWCLHYQEAFAFWHRAYLRWFEHLIGQPVPYWNFMAAGTSVDGDPAAGIPQAFIDESYIHPQSGERRPNPLRYAAAKDGCSKACQQTTNPGEDCRWVQRDPLLYTRGDQDRKAREQKLAQVQLYQQQVSDAMQFKQFSHPQGWPGYPWANIPSFNPPPPDSDYPYRNCNFDGLYEQPHDNFHGWIGADMADNAYTAFDPLFWSYHANIDRMLELWLRAHPQSVFTAGYPIRPFIGPMAQQVDFSDPRAWRYTAIGDLAQDSRRLGYDFAAPKYADVKPEIVHAVAAANGGVGQALYVLFEGVRCTQNSYLVDVFLNAPEAGTDDAHLDNPHYVGRISRIGMGIGDDKGRCVRHGVTRVLNANRAAMALGISSGSSVSADVVVTELHSGRPLDAAEHAALPGFTARAIWGRPWPGAASADVGHNACDSCANTG